MFTFDVSQTLWKTIKSHLLLYEIGSQQTKHVVFNSCVIYFDRFPYRIFLGMLGKKKALSISSYQQNPNLIRCSGGRIHQTITFNNSKVCFCGVFFLRQNITSSKSRTPKLSKFSLLFIVFPVFFLPGIFGIPGEPHRPPTTPRLASFAHKDLIVANE